MLRRFRIVGTLIATLALAPAVAQAESISFLGSGRSAAVSITVGSLFSGTVRAGELNWGWTGTTSNFFSYCIDATTYLQNPQVVTVGSMAAFTSAVPNAGAQISWLFNTFASTIRTSGSGTQAAALQLAIWEVLYDGVGNRNLGGGVFRATATSAIQTQANLYLAQLSAANYLGSTATWLLATSGQSQITNRVPEPSTLLLMGCAGLFLARRRRTKRA